MSLPHGWWRDHKTLKAEVERCGSMSEAARQNGVAESTVQKWARRFGVQAPAPAAPVIEPGEQVSELELLRQRNRELERHLRRGRENEVADEQVIRRLEAAIERHGGPLPSRLSPARKLKPAGDETELVMLFSDTHASEVVSLEETMGLNAYDWSIMVDRMERLADAVLSHKEHFAGKIRTLHLWMLGDMLSGDIHDELAVTNDRPTAEAVVDFAYEVARWVEERFLPEFEHVEIAGVPGNHPRPTKKPQAKLAHNNADWLAYKLLQALLRDNDRIGWTVGRGAQASVMVAGRWRALLMHGDGIRTTMPGVPWGGVVRRIATLEAQFSKAKTPIDYFCLGHFHTANSLDGVHARTFLNGSVKGADEYSLKQFGHGRDASQLLLTFHRRRGWTGTLPVDLQTVTPASEGWQVAA